ncbi:MAG: CpaF family protein [Thermodesulfobacteriota bacterium]
MNLQKRLRSQSGAGAIAPAAIKPEKKSNPSRFQFNDHVMVGRIRQECQYRASEDEAFYRPDSVETRSELTPRVEGLIRDVSKALNHHLSENEIRHLGSELLDDIYGLGPLEHLMADPTITDILINGYNQIYVERHGRIEKTDVTFVNEDHLRNKVERILYTTGRRVDEASPRVDARLPDGSRVNIIIPPLVVGGITVSIRKFPEQHLRAKDMITTGTMVEPMYTFLDQAVKSRLNILICGGTGCGKTTVLNMLSGLIPDDERIITIEDSLELRLQQEHVVRMEYRPPNAEGVGEVTQRDLLRNGLRMRPDRIIIGEVRGEEVLDMFQAMNTGHDGSLATVHANNPRDTISRLELMINLSGISLATAAIQQQIVSAIDLIIHVDRGRDGVRRIVSITDLLGIEEDNIVLQEIFKYESFAESKNGKKGIFKATGIVPQGTSKSGYEMKIDKESIFNCAVEV